VDEVVETPWLITEAILDEHRIDLLVHGEDNQNPIDKTRMMLLPRTQGVSSQELRLRSYQSLQSVQAHNETQNV
jgi:glycerol-3-phosphate cytidylyltransferase-like family protein